MYISIRFAEIGRGALRGLDCALRAEAPLWAREKKADPASCMAARALRASARWAQASPGAREEEEGAGARGAGRGERGSDSAEAAQEFVRRAGSRGSALLGRNVVVGATSILARRCQEGCASSRC